VVRIRLRRVGAKKKPSYRVVVAHQQDPRDGRFVENIGFYNPLTDPSTIEIDQERARHWLGVGAQPSDSVVRLFKSIGLLDGQGKLTPAPIAAVEAEAEIAS
jgi:small subunit ribosomal protein S16